MNDKIGVYLGGAGTIAIAGHTRPDGDCIGACLALYNYIRKNYPHIQADVYLEPVADVYKVMENADQIISDYKEDKTYDVFFALDASDKGRLAGAVRYFDTAKKTVCIDHHISNEGFALENIIFPHASSTCEVLAKLMDMDGVDQAVAEALYIGIICDTGCFKQSNTGKETMVIAGTLMEKGVRFSQLTDEVFYQKTYTQNQLLGRCLLESFLMFSGQCIISVADRKVMDFYKAISSDLEGIIDQMRVTRGVEVAVLLTEIGHMTYKVSMRSNNYMNVAQIAGYFGGGGHIRAAGCTMAGTKYDVINNLTRLIEEQLKNHD
ncbi:bifunctional oligoribonuclease/PAP phosphatase NrnA [Catenibacillus scindens]|uniref:DHH family phosphoesterase n=1 Tax=Catenibacillus scindens TaxID=673271 RepID=UPI00320B05DD